LNIQLYPDGFRPVISIFDYLPGRIDEIIPKKTN
jgi:hypothetical protein